MDLSGRVWIASVAQETPLPDPALDFVMSGMRWCEATRAERRRWQRKTTRAARPAAAWRMQAYDAEARSLLLHGLGFPAAPRQAGRRVLGGWRVRLNLARALMTPPDLLLLDEPTNHLDLDAVLWLEDWLLKYPGTLLIISHDREFLDGVTTHTLHLHEGSAKLYTGNYTAFEHQRAEHLRLQQIAFEKEQAEREHLQKFIARFKAKAARRSRPSRA
jgi:ATP-binding cassette subfamily F protein 3